MYKKDLYTVLENKKIAKDTFLMILKGDTQYITKSGQFINILIEGFYLRRPISVCDFNEETITIIYKVVGEGTKKMAEYKNGTVLDILTGLGNGFDVKKGGNKPLVIGGGVGTPPLYHLTKSLIKEGKKPTVVLGFTSKDDVFYKEEFEALGCNVHIATNDGSFGTKGFVTDVIKDLKDYDFYYTCGPEAMLKAIFSSVSVDGELSFEERMGCGFGGCMGCTCKTTTGYKRICKEGPVLNKEDILW